MTELEQVAARVAKALGLHTEAATDWQEPCWINEEGPNLLRDGSNLFSEYWQVRCRDWLLERGYLIELTPVGSAFMHSCKADREICLNVPAAEFCARAIHALDKQEL